MKEKIVIISENDLFLNSRNKKISDIAISDIRDHNIIFNPSLVIFRNKFGSIIMKNRYDDFDHFPQKIKKFLSYQTVKNKLIL